MEEKMPAVAQMTILEDCNPDVASAIKIFAKAFANNSKRASIWSLVRRHIEPSLSIYVRTHGRLSYAKCFGKDGLADAMKRDMHLFEKTLQAQIRISQDTHWDSALQDTLESILYLGFFCKQRIPKRSVGNNALKGAAPKTVRRVFDGMHSGFCELCWRPCQAEDKPHLRERSSIRFCNEHAPKILDTRYKDGRLRQNPQYRSACNYREKFHAKLKEIYKDLRFNRAKWENLAGDVDETSIRRYAYDFVRARQIDRREMVMKLKIAGSKNVEIARTLGISRQAIHKYLDKDNPPKRTLGRFSDGSIVDLKTL